MFNREKEKVPCMGMIKNAIESQQKTQSVAFIALGVSVIALICVFTLMGAKK